MTSTENVVCYTGKCSYTAYRFKNTNDTIFSGDCMICGEFDNDNDQLHATYSTIIISILILL